MKNVLCIYHGNCADGFGAAWAVRKAFDDNSVEFYAATHGDAPPYVAGRDVIMVDFSYKRPVIETMAEKAKSIFIIDHHKSAREDLEPFLVDEQTAKYWVWPKVGDPETPGTHAEIVSRKVIALFDMERSGAGMTWDFFHGSFRGKKGARPPLIDHIEDRDLWRFVLDGTRNIQAAVFSYPYDFEVWDELMMYDPRDLSNAGEAIERKHHKDIAELLAVCKRHMTIGGHVVPVASLPYTLSSDAGYKMCSEPWTFGRLPAFAACYYDTPEGRCFSLRSQGDFDVSAIASEYGGGGHRNAAGFQVPRDHPLAVA